MKLVCYHYYLISELSKIVDAEGIEKIVLGLPKNMNNTLGESAIRCIDFGKMIEERLNVLVVMQDERLTTVEALIICWRLMFLVKKEKIKLIV